MIATGVAAVLPAGADARPASADTVLRNGFVYTVDEHDSVRQAIAIRRGEIVYVGSNRGARRYVGRRTRVVDLKRRMVMPGLQDGHIHDVMASDRKTCDLRAKPLTVAELQDRLRACLADPALGSGPDDWLEVSNMYLQFLRPAGTKPHKSMLDALGTTRPIVVEMAITGHTTWVNSNALRIAGITRDTPDPRGGVIDRDPDGEPNGLLQDLAPNLVYDKMPPPAKSKLTPMQAAGQRMRDFSREGITSFMVPGAESDEVAAFAALRRAGGLTARAHFAIWARAGTEAMVAPAKLYEKLDRIRKRYERTNELSRSVVAWRPGRHTGPRLAPAPAVSVDGAKLFLDGIAQYPAQTAAMLKPYLDENGKPRTGAGARGQLYVDNKRLDPAVAGLERRGYQSHIHAIGDRAVRVALNAFQAARKANGDLGSHPTIAHAELVAPADFKRFGTLGVTASMGVQWAKPAPDSTDGVKPFVGDRWRFYEPSAAITKAGGRVSLGSDCCLDPFDEWFGLEALVLREADWGPDFPQYAGKVNSAAALSLRQAIRAVTINGAYQLHEEKVTGSLERGKLADLVVLNQNLTRIPPDDISKTDVLMTMVGGRRVWVDRRF